LTFIICFNILTLPHQQRPNNYFTTPPITWKMYLVKDSLIMRQLD